MPLALCEPCDSTWSPSVDILCFQRADCFRNAIRRREQDLLAGPAGFLRELIRKLMRKKRSSF